MNDYFQGPDDVDPVRVHLVRSDLALVDERPPNLKRRGASVRTFTLTSVDPVQQILPLNSRRCSAWIQPPTNDLLIATSQAGAQAGGGGAGLIPGTGSGASVSAYGSITINAATVVGTAAATIPASSLPAGRYRVDAYAYLASATTPTATDLLQISTVSAANVATGVARILSFNAVNNSGAYQPKQAETVWVTVDGTQGISVSAAAAETSTNVQAFNTVVVATREHVATGPFPLNTTDPIWATALILPATVTVFAVIEEA